MSKQLLDDTCPNNLQGSSAQLFLLLMNYLLQTKCDLGSPNQYPADQGPFLKDGDAFDFVIVGGGSAGSALANQLSSNGKWTVLVLEAGDYPSSISDIPLLAPELAQSSEDWQFETVPSENASRPNDQRNPWPRGRALGGTSSINYMIYTRGTKKDFDQWAELGNAGWDWRTIENDYKNMENLLVDDGAEKKKVLSLYSYESGEPLVETIKQAAGQLGVRYIRSKDSFNSLGYYSSPLTIEDGTRLNAAKAFLGKVKHRKNLHVALKAIVTKIAINHETKTATGVEVMLNNKSIHIKARNEVILSSGVIASPQLLMLSGVGPENHLNSLGIKVIESLPVGENLQDHLSFKGFAVKFGVDPLNEENELVDDVYEYFAHRKGKFSEISLLNLLGFINTRNDSFYPNVEILHLLSNPANGYGPLKVFKKLGSAAFFDELIEFVSDGRHLLKLFVSVVKPKSRGRILLRSASPFDKPVIQPGYFTDEHGDDLEVVLEAVRYLERLIETPAFLKYQPEIYKPNVCQHFDHGTNDYWKCVITNLTSTLFHPVGSCKMGPAEDETSVVDSRLRVKGVKKLRVVDASIMPEIVSCHPNAATMLIGYKAGQMITDEWLSNGRTTREL